MSLTIGKFLYTPKRDETLTDPNKGVVASSASKNVYIGPCFNGLYFEDFFRKDIQEKINSLNLREIGTITFSIKDSTDKIASVTDCIFCGTQYGESYEKISSHTPQTWIFTMPLISSPSSHDFTTNELKECTIQDFDSVIKGADQIGKEKWGIQKAMIFVARAVWHSAMAIISACTLSLTKTCRIINDETYTNWYTNNVTDRTTELFMEWYGLSHDYGKPNTIENNIFNFVKQGYLSPKKN